MSQNKLLQFFAYEHLPAHLQAVSKPFGDLAQQLDQVLPVNAESTVAFRKLLEAKDCAVRSTIYRETGSDASGSAEQKAA